MWCKTVPTTEEALTSRLLESTIHALELYGIYLGKELGLYAALAAGLGENTALTPPELAAAAGIDARDAREGLAQQAVAGLFSGDAAASQPDERRDSLPAAHAHVLLKEEHPAHLAPLAQMVGGIGGALERVVAAYRTGEGVAYPHSAVPSAAVRRASIDRRS
jgi:hypothetical protein